jgi:hypothetical protein
MLIVQSENLSAMIFQVVGVLRCDTVLVLQVDTGVSEERAASMLKYV